MFQKFGNAPVENLCLIFAGKIMKVGIILRPISLILSITKVMFRTGKMK